MGTFVYPVEISDTAQQRFERLEAWVDTGAAYTWLPSSRLAQLGYSPVYRRQFRMANGQIIERGLCNVWFRIGQEIQPTLCVFGDDDSMPLLGAFTLEGFGLGVDPVNHALAPVVLNLL